MSKLEIEFLGTGTSTGVPSIRCRCAVCRSADWHDKRLRASAIVRYQGKNLLIDCGPDFRQQILRASDENLDALLITHIHYDHVGGIDDLRAYSLFEKFSIYARADVNKALQHQLPYCFTKDPYPLVPKLQLNDITEAPFEIDGLKITPIPLMHDKLPIFGYRIGPLAYITDCSYISPEEIEKLKNVPLLVINALRYRRHHSHMSLDETLSVIRQINPGEAYLTHMCHEIGFHTVVDKQLPSNVHFAYDTLRLQVED